MPVYLVDWCPIRQARILAIGRLSSPGLSFLSFSLKISKVKPIIRLFRLADWNKSWCGSVVRSILVKFILNVANCFCFVFTLIIGRRPSFVTWMKGNTKLRTIVYTTQCFVLHVQKVQGRVTRKGNGRENSLRACLCQMRGTFGCTCQTLFFPLFKKFKKLRAGISKEIRRVGKPNAIPFALSTVGIFSNEWTSQQRWPHPFLSFFFFWSGRLVASILNDPVKMFPVHSCIAAAVIGTEETV